MSRIKKTCSRISGGRDVKDAERNESGGEIDRLSSSGLEIIADV